MQLVAVNWHAWGSTALGRLNAPIPASPVHIDSSVAVAPVPDLDAGPSAAVAQGDAQARQRADLAGCWSEGV